MTTEPVHRTTPQQSPVRRSRARALLAAATAVVALGAAAGTAVAAPGAEQGRRPVQTYVLPDTAVFPEGSAADQASGTFWVSSVGTGAIVRGRVGEAATEEFLPGGADGRTTAVGLEHSRGVLYVAGGTTGQVWAYDARTGDLLARLATGVEGGFVNDVAVTRDGAAWFTDSFQPFLYRLARDASGTWSLERRALTGVPYRPGFNLNGIAATPDGRALVVVHTTLGTLYRVDPRTGAATGVDTGGADLTAGDGLEALGNRLYVVRNAASTVTRLQLVRGGRAARLVSETTDPGFDFPTTAEVLRGRLLVVNSQLNRMADPAGPQPPFTVTAVPLP